MLLQVKVLKENAAPFSTQMPAPRKSVSKSQEQLVTAGPPPAPVSQTPVSSSNAAENGGEKESEGLYFVVTVPLFLLVSLLYDLHPGCVGYSV